MQTQNKLIDDLARVATSALGVAAGLRQEAEGQLRRQFERILADMDLVTREEYEVARALAETARAEQEALAERVAALEAQLATAGKAGTRTKAAKGAAAKGAAAKGAAAKGAATKRATAKRATAKRAPGGRATAKTPSKGTARTAAPEGATKQAEPAKTGATGNDVPGTGERAPGES